MPDGPSVIRAVDVRGDADIHPEADSDDADEFVPYRLGTQDPAEGNESPNERSTRGASLAAVGLGMWEAHTSGFGSKLLAKMGYVAGAGLGIRGRSEHQSWTRVACVHDACIPARHASFIIGNWMLESKLLRCSFERMGQIRDGTWQ